MIWTCKFAAAAALFGLTLGAAAGANASVLTFDGNICNGGQVCGNGSNIDSTYGDIAGQLDVQYADTDANLQFWDIGYNELINVAWGNHGGASSIILVPRTGFSVTLNGFDLGAWPSAANGSQVTISAVGGPVLFSSGPIVVGTGNLSSHFTGGYTSASGIIINWGPDSFNTGIDNVDFTTRAVTGGVPEPATWAMMILGLGAAGSLIRRRRALAA